MTKPKLLLISGISPFPQMSGGATRIKQTLLHLSEKYEIYFYFFLAENQFLGSRDKAFLDQCTVFFKSFTLSKKSILISLSYAIPYHFSNYFSKELIEEFKNIQNKIDFCQVRIESTQILYLAKYLFKNQLNKFVALDVSTVSFWRRAFASRNQIKIVIRLISFLQVYLYEKQHFSNFTRIIAMSRQDSFFIKKLFTLKNIDISQNGIEKIKFLPLKNSDKISLGFVGSIGHSPNKEALNFLINDIFPILKKRAVNSEVIVLGKDNKCFYKQVVGVKFIDFFENLEDFYSQIDILVAPLFSGSGTRLKILESLSYGRPVITTKIGAEGLNLNSKYLTIIGDDNKLSINAWVNKIIITFNSKKELKIDFSDLEKQLSKFIWRKIFSKE